MLRRLTNSVNLFLLLMHRASIRKPTLFISTWVILSMALAFGLNRVQVFLSIDDLIDPDFTTYTQLKTVNNEFKDMNSLFLIVDSPIGFTKNHLCDLQTWVLHLSDSESNLTEINSSFGVRKPEYTHNKLKMMSVLNVDCTDLKKDESKSIAAGFTYIETSPWKNILASSKSQSISFIFKFTESEDQRYGTVNVAAADRVKKSFNIFFNKHDSKKELKPKWTGFLSFQSEVKKAMDQAQALNALMVLICLLFFRFFLKSWKLGILFNLTFVSSLILVYGLMGYLKLPIDVLTTSVGMMLIVSSLEDFIFVSYGVIKFKWTLKKSLRKFLIPTFWTSLTTAIGFGSLMTSELSIIRRFGGISAAAAMIEWIMVFLILRSVLQKYPKNKLLQIKSENSINKVILEKITYLKSSFRLAFFLCLVIPAALLFTDSIKVQDSPDDFFDKNHIVSTVSANMLETKGWMTDMSLVFSTETSQDFKTAVINEVSKQPLVSLVEYNTDIKKFLIQGLDPTVHELVLQLWDDSDFSKRLVSEDGLERAQLYIKSMQVDKVEELNKKIEQLCPNQECYIAGATRSYSEFGSKILQTLLSSLGLSLLLVTLIIILLGHKLPKSQLIACIISSIWGPIALLGLFILFEIPLFLISSVCASVLVGLAGDNAIQFIFTKKGVTHQLNQLSYASLLVTVGMISLSTVFLLSILAPLAKLGLFMIIGFVLMFFGDVWILKGLLSKK